jgi:uncharacterized OB-fold protein
MVDYLADFARKNQVILIATYLPYSFGKRSTLMQELTFKKTSTLLSFTKTRHSSKLALEKHPNYALGVIEMPSQTTTLMDFIAKQPTQLRVTS